MNPSTPPDAAPPAALWLRLAAAGYDLLPLTALLFVAAGLALLLTGGELDPHTLWYRLCLLGVAAAYFTYSWSRGGQTLGMRPWRLQLVRSDGGKIEIWRALLRFAVACVSLGAGGLGFIWALIDSRRRTWHDLAAATELRRLPQA